MKITEKELLEKGLIRPATRTFSAKVGRWQYKDRDDMYTTTYSKEIAIERAKQVLSAERLKLSEGEGK